MSSTPTTTKWAGFPPGNGWPNMRIAPVLTTAVGSAALRICNLSQQDVLAFNGIIRAVRITDTLQRGTYLETAFSAFSMFALFFPHYGNALALTCDIGVIAYDFYHYKPSPSRTASFPESTVKPTNVPNACRILNIAEDQAGDRILIEMYYSQIVRTLIARMALTSSPPIKAKIQEMLNDAETARNLLLASLK